MDMVSRRIFWTFLAFSVISTIAQQIDDNQSGINPNDRGINVDMQTNGWAAFPGTSMYAFGQRYGDAWLRSNEEQIGKSIDLFMYFPFYGGAYNYTHLTAYGALRFAYPNQQGQVFNVGPEEAHAWPEESDPAMIAPYLCQQQVANQVTSRYPNNEPPGVYYRVVRRTNMGRVGDAGGRGRNQYTVSDLEGDSFLDTIMVHLQQGIVGSTSFKADTAVVVTWHMVVPSTAGSEQEQEAKQSSYQVVWATDRAGALAYTIINYHRLAFSSNDLQGNSRMGRCKALFNGGNMTGVVNVDPTDLIQENPAQLADNSAVPDMWNGRGRYMFRVDDVVRRGGCSNKTSGTVPLLVAPDVVNMLGGNTVEVNGLCWTDPTQNFNLYVQEREYGRCQRMNSAIAKCKLPRVQYWGTMDVYFQPEAITENKKAYVGFIYFAPPGINPMSLDIGNIHEWYELPFEKYSREISWYIKNYTNPDYDRDRLRRVPISPQDLGALNDIYNVQLNLYLIGYKEAKDVKRKKFVPMHRVLARLDQFQNNIGLSLHGDNRRTQTLDLANLPNFQWLISDWEIEHELHTYRVGYLRLAAQQQNYDPTDRTIAYTEETLPPGQMSVPIPLQWLWTVERIISPDTRQEDRIHRARSVAGGMCMRWFNEDGAQHNFIRDTETNASCPCKADQAKADLGRFMPHPRCSTQFRSKYCAVTLGANTCFLSAQNVFGSTSQSNSGQLRTHNGQVCCYDKDGFLMHTNYQAVIQIKADYPYSPGFPQRAYEFGTSPYQGQFEVPTLSAMYHDIVPYFMCCKYPADSRCQLFYWRRPSSGCQQYRPPATGLVFGAGHFYSMDGHKFSFDEEGIFTVVHVPANYRQKEVNIQIRLERYPDRTVDFGGRFIFQESLVQPTNATVITGIALQESGKDRVQVVIRKDTRRFKYRTNVVVDGKLRYFDTMWIQRYDGILIYMNDVNAGQQADIYVVMEEPRIGLHIQESYARDFKRPGENLESYGMLDVQISVDPSYEVLPDPTRPFDVFRDPRMEGLLVRPFGDQQAGYNEDFQPASSPDSLKNDWLVAQEDIDVSPGGGTLRVSRFPNLFEVPSEVSDVWPAKAMVQNRIYKVARNRYPPLNPDMMQVSRLQNWLRQCDQGRLRPVISNFNPGNTQVRTLDTQSLQGDPECKPSITQSTVSSLCENRLACTYDYALMFQRKVADDGKRRLADFDIMRLEAMKRYNSCGAMNVEYPEYLMMTPPTGSKYLEDDSIRYECFQDHWIKGDDSYTCSRYMDSQRNFQFRWNQGWQPWCRARSLERVFTGLAATFGILIIVAIIAAIFLCCYCTRKRRVQRRSSSFRGQQFRQPPRLVPVLEPRDAEPIKAKEPIIDYPPPPKSTTVTLAKIPDSNLKPRENPLGEQYVMLSHPNDPNRPTGRPFISPPSEPRSPSVELNHSVKSSPNQTQRDLLGMNTSV